MKMTPTFNRTENEEIQLGVKYKFDQFSPNQNDFLSLNSVYGRKIKELREIFFFKTCKKTSMKTIEHL